MRVLALLSCLLLGACATRAQRLADDCQLKAVAAVPDQTPTTQGHDQVQAVMGECMKTGGYEFDWNIRRCDADYPRTIGKGGCYRRVG